MVELWNAFVAALPQFGDKWPAVFGFMLASAVVGWAVGRFMYGQRIEDLKTSAQTLRDRMALRDEQIAASASPDQARALIEALEKRIAAFEPWSLSVEQARHLRLAIEGRHAGIQIIRDVASPSLEPIQNQLISIFQEAGWAVHHHATLGVPPAPRTRVTLCFPQTWTDQERDTLRTALRVAGFDFTERENEAIGVPDGLPTIWFATAKQDAE
jgi:hypothetical protein